jgi:peroxiredoxin Q/BCP
VHRLSDHAGKHVVLVFYPIDSSPACSLEMARVSSGYAALQAAGADVFGISVQNGESHKKFCGKVGIPYPLLSDTQRAVSQAYGTTGSAKGVADRVTVIVDGSGKVAYIDPDVDRHPFSIPNLWIDWIKAGSSPA